jgi:hypothetical protein
MLFRDYLAQQHAVAALIVSEDVGCDLVAAPMTHAQLRVDSDSHDDSRLVPR